MNLTIVNEQIASFKSSFIVDDLARKLLPKFGAYGPKKVAEVVAEASILARHQGLPVTGVLARCIADLADVERAAWRLLRLLRRGRIYFEDHREVIVWCFAFLELERRAALLRTDPNAKDGLMVVEPSMYIRPTVQQRRAA
jgi:hypothetical protein